MLHQKRTDALRFNGAQESRGIKLEIILKEAAGFLQIFHDSRNSITIFDAISKILFDTLPLNPFSQSPFVISHSYIIVRRLLSGTAFPGTGAARIRFPIGAPGQRPYRMESTVIVR